MGRMLSPVKPLSSARAAWRGGPQPAPHGFTAIELMVVIAMIAILAALAAPSFNTMIERWRVYKAIKGMESTLHLARSEAIKRNGLVAIEKLPNNTNGCTLATNDQNWGCGWQVFADGNGNGRRDGSEEILHVTPAPKNVNVMLHRGGRSLRLDRWGQIGGLGAAGIQFVPEISGVASPAVTRLCVSSGGRLDARRQAVSCS